MSFSLEIFSWHRFFYPKNSVKSNSQTCLLETWRPKWQANAKEGSIPFFFMRIYDHNNDHTYLNMLSIDVLADIKINRFLPQYKKKRLTGSTKLLRASFLQEVGKFVPSRKTFVKIPNRAKDTKPNLSSISSIYRRS